MKSSLALLFLILPLTTLGESRTWRAVGGYKTQASFVSYEGGIVTLRKESGEEVSLPIGRLHPADRTDVITLSSRKVIGNMPQGPVEKPSGRREITWHKLEGQSPWPESLNSRELQALQSVGRTWKHAESRFFIIHYQSLGYAKKVSRIADFLYPYIAADLPGFRDRLEKKSHIVVVRNRSEWLQFLRNSGSFPEWAGAFVRGDSMFLFDMDNNEANASILAHEMSHLVLNRFFVHRPPLWLNEGLAEWYGNKGYETFKGQKVDEEDGMGHLPDPISISDLFGSKTYPRDLDLIRRFYGTSKQLVGMLMMSRDQPTFVQFLKLITVDGSSADLALEEIYGFSSPADVETAFDAFLN